MKKKKENVENDTVEEIEVNDYDYTTEDTNAISEDHNTFDMTQYQNPFSKEELQNVHHLRNTYYKSKLMVTIDGSDLYDSAKRALRDVVNNYFDQNWMLSNLERRHSSWTNKNSSSDIDEYRGAWLTLKLNLLKATVSMCRSDRSSPDYITITTGIKSHFKAIMSRAKGPQRERAFQARSKVVQEIISRNIDESKSKNKNEGRKPLW